MPIEVNDLTEAHRAWVLLKAASEMLYDIGGEYYGVGGKVSDAQNQLRDLINQDNE